MLLRFEFFSKPSAPNAVPYCMSSPVPAEFPTIEDARAVAKSTADAPKMGAHSFRISSLDEKLSEHWVRSTTGWEQVDAQRP
jgi:hypothetical protein